MYGIEKLQNYTIIELLKLLRSVMQFAAAAKLLQLCPIVCDPIDGSPPGSSVPGILQVAADPIPPLTGLFQQLTI